MVDFFIESFQALIVVHGTAAIFLIGFLEDILFFVPSALVFMGAGFVMIGADLTFWEAFWYAIWHIGVPAALGVTAGALFVYGAVYQLGKPFVIRYGKYLGVSWEEIERFQKKLSSIYGDELALFLMRVTPVFPLSVASILSGLVRLPMREFIFITLIGIFIRTTFASLFGWYVGRAYVYYAQQFELVEEFGWMAAIILVAIFLGWHFYRHRRQSS